jgi:hypothetical protein
MKKVLLIILFITTSLINAQNRKLEVSNNETGKSVYFEENQKVKVGNTAGKQFEGEVKFLDSETISVEGNSIKIDSINSIRTQPKSGLTLKKTLLYTGIGLVAGSGIAAANADGRAFILFAGGTGTVLVSGILNNGSTIYLKRKNTFKIVSQ